MRKIQLSFPYKITTIVFSILHWLLMASGVILIASQANVIIRTNEIAKADQKMDQTMLFYQFVVGCLQSLNGIALMFFAFFPYSHIPTTVIVNSLLQILLFYSSSLSRAFWALIFEETSLYPRKMVRGVDYLLTFSEQYEKLTIEYRNYEIILEMKQIVYVFEIVFSIATIVLMVIVHRKQRTEYRGNGSERKSVEE